MHLAMGAAGACAGSMMVTTKQVPGYGCDRGLCWLDDWMCRDRCLAMDATDARAHVALGRLLVQQRRYDEARALYEEGSTATGGSSVSASVASDSDVTCRLSASAPARPSVHLKCAHLCSNWPECSPEASTLMQDALAAGRAQSVLHHRTAACEAGLRLCTWALALKAVGSCRAGNSVAGQCVCTAP